MAILKNNNVTLAVGEELPIIFNGNYIRVLESNGRVRVHIGSSTVIMDEGDKVRVDQFTEFRIENMHIASNKVILVLGDGEVDFGRDANEITGIVETSPAIPTTLTTYEDIAVTSVSAEVVASNANRKEVILENTGTKSLRVGDSDVSNTRGK